MAEVTGQWVECITDTDYEIYSEYPYPIRRKGSDRMIKERIAYGYVQCTLNCKNYQKHRVIAQQFIPNPDNLPQVDHINHIRSDNRLENLRWVSPSTNQRNKSGQKGIKYEFFDEIPCDDPDDIIEVRDYGAHEFENLYYCDDCFYFFNGIQYRRLHANIAAKGAAYVFANNINDVKVKIYYTKFKKLYDLI